MLEVRAVVQLRQPRMHEDAHGPRLLQALSTRWHHTCGLITLQDLLRLYFLPDYNVTLAETIIPGAELSQHISTAGARGCHDMIRL